MVPVLFALAWGGYAVGSWGWCLIQDYNITAGQWLDPIHPYKFPAKGAAPAPISPDSVFPGRDISVSTAAASSTGGAGKKAGKPAPVTAV